MSFPFVAHDFSKACLDRLKFITVLYLQVVLYLQPYSPQQI